ncbi:MAG: UvrD-helicase domain-containing protein [Bacteroidales bacterium]
MFTVYKASAGSGKTTHLVAEYIALCFTDIRKYKNILAITFTNNATAEMKERIVNTLHRFSFYPSSQFSGSEKAIFDIIALKFNWETDSEKRIQQKSTQLLKAILYDYPNFSISTIDSFFQRLIRSFAFDLGLNLNYNVEIKLDDFYSQTIDILLHKISNENKELTERIIRLVEKQMSETGQWNIERELRKTLGSIYNEDAFIPLKELDQLDAEEREEQIKQMISKQVVTNNEIKELAKKGDQLFKSSQLNPSDFNRKDQLYQWFYKVSLNPSYRSYVKYMDESIEKGSFTKEEGLIDPTIHQAIVKIYEQITERQTQLSRITILTKNIHSLLLLFDLKEIMDDIKMRDNLFYLSETNGKIYEEIKDEETPYIYEKMGNKYSYFFIDEFQDTSKMQWENILPLIKNALSGANQYEENGQTILFGDVKQAIYRFRNGDSNLFKELSTLTGFQTQINAFGIEDQDFLKKSLQTNYRTSKNVVEFNNRFFEFLKGLPEGNSSYFRLADQYYDDVVQQIHSQESGFVHILFKSEEDSELYIENRTLEAIQDSISRGYEYKDIAVLVRGNESGNQLARFLSNEEHQIPVISSDSLLLNSSNEVNLLLSNLQYLLNPDDKLIQLSIIDYLINHLPSTFSIEEAIHSIGNGTDFFSILALFQIQFDRETMLGLPLFTLVKEFIRIYHLTDRNAYTVALLDTIIEYQNHHSGELTQFLSWWNDQKSKLSIISPEKINAVCITTIHKSKGLEYPVVIIPLTQYSQANTKSKIWYEDQKKDSGLPYLLLNTSKSALDGSELEYLYQEEAAASRLDNLNILYVAQTRAKDCLYLITDQPTKGNYAKFLAAFIHYIEPENQELILDYWYGDPHFTVKREDIVPTFSSFGKIYNSNFTLDSNQLAYHLYDDKSEEQTQGLMVHHYLSKLEDFPQDEEELNNMEFPVNEAEAAKIKSALRTIMHDKSLNRYFDKGVTVLNETAILTKEGEIRRPDRVVFYDGEVWVFDYKTGQENKKYQKQLNEYCLLLKEMGFKKVQGRLIYI